MPDDRAAQDIGALASGRQIAVAESCTGGLVAQALAKAPGSSDWFRGGVIAYQPTTKFEVLDVTPGPVVTERAAAEMAAGVARHLRADAAVSVTGAAGPQPHDGAPPGTVVIGVAVDGAVRTERHHFAGTPEEVCARATETALAALRAALARAHETSALGPERAIQEVRAHGAS